MRTYLYEFNRVISSAVERPAVNRKVVGSNPTWPV